MPAPETHILLDHDAGRMKVTRSATIGTFTAEVFGADGKRIEQATVVMPAVVEQVVYEGTIPPLAPPEP